MASVRDRAIFWSIAALLVAGAALAYRVLLGPSPSAPAAAPPPAAAVRLTIAQAQGEVTIVRGGARARAAPGDELRADDAIETAPGARVRLDGGVYEVALDEGGSFDVREITAELSRFRLGQGLVSARVREEPGPGRAVEIEGAGGALVRTRGGDVAVARSGDVVAVGVERGSAEFAAGGATVVLGAGQQSTAAPGGRPSPPARIPASLLLKVSWPEERATNQRRIVVTGKTEPGAIVVVGAERVDVRPDGRFTHVITLREGRQRLSARAHGVGGSASSDGPAIVLDTRAPDPRFDTRDLWANPRK